MGISLAFRLFFGWCFGSCGYRSCFLVKLCLFVCVVCIVYYARVHAFLCIALWGYVCVCVCVFFGVFFLILSLFFFGLIVSAFHHLLGVFSHTNLLLLFYSYCPKLWQLYIMRIHLPKICIRLSFSICCFIITFMWAYYCTVYTLATTAHCVEYSNMLRLHIIIYWPIRS